ncbi:atrial natriuretic peptide receptor 1-like isoform X2 [Paramacrobiotus metropolitanus]|uniref:atrial natriuretic peptide receptor 1-like isoform X2 n=1 Tax=Paramacrobiotus metropolitanus TaxID=2943436 RepID=UPI002445B07D|nr:atrial natriuretic peptide receptor 1-like isoform X2 [Paramacrobiotus metropolitanus]
MVIFVHFIVLLVADVGLAYQYPCNFTILVILPLTLPSSHISTNFTQHNILLNITGRVQNTSSLPCDLKFDVINAEHFQDSCSWSADIMVDGIAKMVAESYFTRLDSDDKLAAVMGSGCEQADAELFALARVILLLMDPIDVRQIMLLAFHSPGQRAYISGEYVFISLSYSVTNMYFEVPDANFTMHHTVNPEEESLMQAFRSLFLIRLKPHTDPIFGTDFSGKVDDSINGTLVVEEENEYFSTFDKAIRSYDAVLSDINETDWPQEIFNGKAMAQRFVNRTFSFPTKNLTFSEDNELRGRFELLNFVPTNRTFWKVLEFYETDRIPRVVGSVQWVSYWPPPNEPVCGFDGTKSICFLYENRTAFIAVLASVVSVVIAVLAVVIIYRLVKRQRALANATWWRIAPEELSKSERGAAGSHAMFRFETVHLIPFIQTIMTKKTERELRKLRMTKHDKLVRFYGLCTSADLHVIVMEYCSRGNLHYLSRHSDPFLCDWNFKFSVMKDVAEGLLFIHTSWMKCHGRLRSDKCMLNARYTAKIGDYALHDLLPEDTLEPDKKLWTAPEILRLKGQEPTVEQKQLGDLYSLSIIMTEVSMMCDPFMHTNASLTPSQILDSLEKGRQPPFRPKLRLTGLGQQAVILKELIENCWKEDPAQRMAIKPLLVELRTLAGEQGTHMLQDLLDRMTKHAEDLEKKTIQMTKDLIQQRANYKEIITNILPRAVALRVIAQEKIVPETYDAITILVASLANIPAIIEKCQLDQFIDVLNAWIRVLTYGTVHFGLTRVRSLNDTWMAVGGFPQKIGFRHVAHTAQCALYLRETVSQLEVPNMTEEKPKALIGFHTGPAMTCLVGKRMPFYVIIGDTPIISRILQCTCEAGKIHISQHTATLLGETRQFFCEPRQKTALHEKAVFRTCWLTGMTKQQPF